MSRTVLSIEGENFFINGNKVYSELKNSPESVHGLMMNARFIQGVFDDKSGREGYNRYGKVFDPDVNTDELIEALPLWYNHGLRAFTVGFQGGGPCFTRKNSDINNNPYGAEGLKIDEAYEVRMDKLIKAADRLGMVVIVSLLYPGQLPRIKDGRAVASAVKVGATFLKNGGYTNVMIEICNEMDVDQHHSMVFEEESMAVLIDIAREYSGGMLVGCSLGGGRNYKEVCEASDVVLIHGNECSRQNFYKTIQEARRYAPGKPVLCNEDSQAIGQLKVAFHERVSWGYYNNMTKQEPPTYWGITKGEDEFFARRMAMGLGIEIDLPSPDDQYYLQGLEAHMTDVGLRWLRLASLYPETIDYVEFYNGSVLVDTCFDESFSIYWDCNWRQSGIMVDEWPQEWQAKIFLRDGRILER